jgi:predicted amidohydrolase YtcJ
VVLDGDPLTCAETKLKDLPVDMTIVGGRVVFQRAAVTATDAMTGE